MQNLKALARFVQKEVRGAEPNWSLSYVTRVVPQLEREGLEGAGLLAALAYQAKMELMHTRERAQERVSTPESPGGSL